MADVDSGQCRRIPCPAIALVPPAAQRSRRPGEGSSLPPLAGFADDAEVLRLVVSLNAVIIAITDEQPRVLTVAVPEDVANGFYRDGVRRKERAWKQEAKAADDLHTVRRRRLEAPDLTLFIPAVRNSRTGIE